MVRPRPKPVAKEGAPSHLYSGPNAPYSPPASDTHPITRSGVPTDSPAFRSLPPGTQERIIAEREAQGIGGTGGTKIIVSQETGESMIVPEDTDTKAAREQAVRQRTQEEARLRAKKRILGDMERPAEKAARIASIEPTGSPKFIELAERRRQELLKGAGPEAELAHYPQVFIKSGGITGSASVQVSGGIGPIATGIGSEEKKKTKDQKEIKESWEPKPTKLLSQADIFEEKVNKLKEQEQGFAKAVEPYTSGTDYAASMFTFGFGKKVEDRGWWGVPHQIVKGFMDLPISIAYLAYFGPYKGYLAGQALRGKDTKGAAAKEIFLSAPLRTGREFVPDTPQRAANLITALGFGYLKGRTMIKEGTGFRIKTRVDYKTSSYIARQSETLKTAVTGKSTIKGTGLTMEYLKQQILQKAAGKNAPAVSVSTGTITSIGRNLKVTIVQVGRKISGSIRGGKYDIVFSKTPTGEIKVTYLKPIDIPGKFGQAIDTFIAKKYGYEKPIVKSVRYMDYQPENIALQDTFMVKEPNVQNAGFGTVQGENINLFTMVRQKIGQYNILGKSEQFYKLRDIKKGYAGRATINFQQTDIATPQLQRVQIGTSPSITYEYPNIEYAIQPTLKPNVKIYGLDYQAQGPVRVIDYTKTPEIVTARESSFISQSVYSYEQSGIKPIKAAVQAVKPLFGSKSAQLTIGKKITVQAPEPVITSESVAMSPIMSGAQLIEMSKGPQSFGYIPVIVNLNKPDTASKPKLEIMPDIKTELKTEPVIVTRPKISTKTNIKPKLEIKLRTETKPKTTTRTETRTETRAEIKPKTEIKTEIKTIVKAITETKTPTITQTNTPARFNSPRPRLPTPPGLPDLPDANRRGGYSILIRRRGRFLPIGTAKSLKSAFARGSFAVDVSSAASFKIEPIGGAPAARSPFQFINPRKFRLSQFDSNVFVEKKKFRISTPGEKGEITSRGLFALSQKRGKKSRFNIFGG